MNKSYIVVCALIFTCALLFLYETTWKVKSPSIFSNENVIPSPTLRNDNYNQKTFKEPKVKNISCNCDENSRLYLPNAMKVLNSRDSTKKAFYFIETSQLGILKARQVCAVESTAKVHPNADIYLLIVQTLPEAINLELNYALQLSLRHYHNIHVLSIQMHEYFQGSVLEDWYLNGKIYKSAFPLHHKSDVLRIFTLYKFGGIYLDLDFVTKKSLSQFNNFLCSESSDVIANGGLGFEKNHPLTLKFVEEIRDTFDGSAWSYNGPALVTRVMTRYCGVSVINMTEEICHGVTVLPPTTFYPIPYQSWRRFFDERNAMETMKELRDSPAVHVWNKLSEGGEISIGSQQPYGLLAKEFCPRTYWSCELKF